MLTLLVGGLTALAPCLAPSPKTVPAPLLAQVAEAPTLDERLELLVERVERARVENHIPGLALAVVKDDEVVLARGFGLADVENERPVDAQTLFAIGSTTKAFTASLLGMLQDEGKLDFDDPVTDYLPFFQLPIEGPDEKGDSVVTLRDLLCHRTGFTRMSMLWAGGTATRRQVLEAAVQAEPWAGFREKFYYNNVMFLAAGMAGAAAAGGEWNELLRARILDPLGMDSTTLSIVDAQQDERLALGYEWNEESQSFEHKTMLNLDAIGPAGCINSNAHDMAQWLRFQLGQGEFEGERLLSKKAIKDTWRSNIKIAGGVSYGLGWMLRRHNGKRVVEHGGNINGFAAEVALMPKEGLGFVLLTNVSATPLQQMSIPLVFDTLLEEIVPEELAEAGAEAGDQDFSEYLGKYRADFGSFEDVDFVVQVKNGHLAVDVPGQTVYELHAPDEQGKWFFRMTDAIAVSFERNSDGEVIVMRMHQGGMNFELLREGVVLSPEIPLVELQKFLGPFRDPALEMNVEVVIHAQRLAVDVPEQMVFELRTPDEEGWRRFRITDDLALRFEEDEQGEVNTLVFLERGTERRLERAGPAPEVDLEPLPGLDEFFELYQPGGRAQLLEKYGSLRSSGVVRLPQCGIEGSYSFEVRAEPPAFHMTIDYGVFGGVQYGSDGESAWTFHSGAGYEVLSGKRLQQLLDSHPLIIFGDWRAWFDPITVLRAGDEQGRRTLVVKLERDGSTPYSMHVDAESGRLVRMEHFISQGAAQFPITSSFSDYRDVEGIPTAHSVVEESDAAGRSEYTLVEMEVGVELAPDFHEYRGE